MKTEADRMEALGFCLSKDGIRYYRGINDGTEIVVRTYHGWQAGAWGWWPDVYFPDPLSAVAYSELMNWGQG